MYSFVIVCRLYYPCKVLHKVLYWTFVTKFLRQIRRTVLYNIFVICKSKRTSNEFAKIVFRKILSYEWYLNYGNSGSVWNVVSIPPQHTALYDKRHDHHRQNVTQQSIFKPFTSAYLPSYCKFLTSDVLCTVTETEHESSDCILMQSTDIVIVMVIVTATILNVVCLPRLSILEYHSKSFSSCWGLGGKVKTTAIKIYKTQVSEVGSCLHWFWFSFV